MLHGLDTRLHIELVDNRLVAQHAEYGKPEVSRRKRTRIGDSLVDAGAEGRRVHIAGNACAVGVSHESLGRHPDGAYKRLYAAVELTLEFLYQRRVGDIAAECRSAGGVCLVGKSLGHSFRHRCEHAPGAVEEIIASALVEARHYIAAYPAVETRHSAVAAVIEVVEHQRHSLGHHIVEVEAQLIVALMVDFARECAQHALKERVDGADIEIAVVVEHFRQRLRRRGTEFVRRASEQLHQPSAVVRPAVGGKQRELAHYSALHLLGGGVGKSDGQNAAMAAYAPGSTGVARIVEHIGVGAVGKFYP